MPEVTGQCPDQEWRCDACGGYFEADEETSLCLDCEEMERDRGE
jgi:hypothetical protein